MTEDVLAAGDRIANQGVLNHNVFIVWKPEYYLGIPIIDEHHRGIVTIINSLHFSMQNDYVEDMFVSIVNMINDYTNIHFQIEEDFLQKNGFPNVGSHFESHRELIADLSAVGKKSKFHRDPYQFMNFLKNWWIDHICKEDLMYRDYFFKKQ